MNAIPISAAGLRRALSYADTSFVLGQPNAAAVIVRTLMELLAPDAPPPLPAEATAPPAQEPDPHPSAEGMATSRTPEPSGAGESTQECRAAEGGEPPPEDLPRWSRERKALFLKLRGKFVVTAIAERLSALPGPSISSSQASAYWKNVLSPKAKADRDKLPGARKALLRAGWDAGHSEDAIAERLNREPGPILTGRAVRSLAGWLGFGARVNGGKPMQPAAAAAPKPASGPPPASKAVQAAPPPLPEIPPAAPTNPAGGMAVPNGRADTRPPPQPAPERAGGAPATLPALPRALTLDAEEQAEAAAMVKAGKSGSEIAEWFGQPLEATASWVASIRRMGVPA